MKRVIYNIFFIIVSVFLSLHVAFSSVEVFSDYSTFLRVNSDNTIDISKDLTLRNVHTVGIVPGQIEFKIGRGTDGSMSEMQVTNVIATDRFGSTLNNRVTSTDEFTVIVLDVFYPLLPGFEYRFTLNYTLEYSPGGIFFRSLQVPIRDSTIPIEQGKFVVELPPNRYFTFIRENPGLDIEIRGNRATWIVTDDLPEYIEFEYSYLPIRIGSFKGSYVFWITVNLLLLLFLIYEVRKAVRKARNERS